MRWILWSLIGFLGAGLVLLLLWAVVVVPPLLIDVRRITNPADQAKAVNDLRATLAGVLAGLAVAAGAIVGALNFRETSRQNRAVLELQRRGQVTERFTKAIEQLGQRGDDKLDVRIGAVYALEQIARDSAELHWPIMEVLTAYLREHGRVRTPAGDVDDAPPGWLPADHQAIATVLGRRHVAHDRPGECLDLHETCLAEADLRRADLGGADLRGADLRRAELRWAYLGGTDLRGADLSKADLRGADLPRADLGGADLHGADLGDRAELRGAELVDANLQGANLAGANLVGANLGWSTLTRADMVDADLRGANLIAADLRGANLGGADVREVKDLTPEQLAAAVSIEGTRLPPELAEQLARCADEAATDPGATLDSGARS